MPYVKPIKNTDASGRVTESGKQGVLQLFFLARPARPQTFFESAEGGPILTPLRTAVLSGVFRVVAGNSCELGAEMTVKTALHRPGAQTFGANSLADRSSLGPQRNRFPAAAMGESRRYWAALLILAWHIAGASACAIRGELMDCAGQLLRRPPAAPDGVTVVDLSDNAIRFPDLGDFESYGSVTTLILSNNPLEKLTGWATLPLKAIERLGLRNCSLTVLRADVVRSTFVLDVAHNPNLAFVGEFDTVREVDVSGNNHTFDMEYPRGVFIMANTLIARDNNMTVIPGHAFSGMINLRHLDLSHNRIEMLDPNAFAGCRSLETLDLRSNRLRFVPAWEFGELGWLQVLRLDDNEFEIVGRDEFAGLADLQTLTLEGNPLGVLPTDAFEWLMSVATVQAEFPCESIRAGSGLVVECNRLKHNCSDWRVIARRACRRGEVAFEEILERRKHDDMREAAMEACTDCCLRAVVWAIEKEAECGDDELMMRAIDSYYFGCYPFYTKCNGVMTDCRQAHRMFSEVAACDVERHECAPACRSEYNIRFDTHICPLDECVTLEPVNYTEAGATSGAWRANAWPLLALVMASVLKNIQFSDITWVAAG
jgi:hypothetical protein